MSIDVEEDVMIKTASDKSTMFGGGSVMVWLGIHHDGRRLLCMWQVH